MPAIAFAFDGQRRDQLHVGLGRRRHGDRVRVVDVVGEADLHAALAARRIASPTISAVSRPRLKSYCARSSVCRRAVEERGDRVRDLRRLLAAVRQSSDLDALVHRPSRRRPHRADHELLPGRGRCRASGATGSRAYLEARADAPHPPRRRGAGLPRRPRLGHPVHVRAAADGRGPGRGDRDDRPPRARRARARGRRAALERRADASRAPTSNRAPTRREIAAGVVFARRARARAAASSPSAASRRRRSAAPYVRHPAHGGAAAFAAGLRALIAAMSATSAATPCCSPPGSSSMSGMIQLAVALGTVTIVAVTGVQGILGLGPAIFLSPARSPSGPPAGCPTASAACR